MKPTAVPPLVAPDVAIPLATSLELIGQSLRNQLRRLEAGERCWQIPQLKKRFQTAAGMHYHFNPEIFIQVGGMCEFTFAAQNLRLRAGEICVVPGGIAHSEIARHTDTPYKCVVVNFYNKTLYVHGAHTAGLGRPATDNMYFFTTPLYADLIAYLSRIGELNHEDPVAHQTPIRALLTAELSLLTRIVDEPQAQPSPVRDVVTRCQWLVKRHASDETLGLKFLAAQLELSPNYLSRLFRDKTGERINEHITRVRIQNATDGLRTTQLSVKAIGAACGFKDTSYFCRVFRQIIGQTPQDYRAKTYRASLAVKHGPKTVLAKGEHFVGGGVYAPLALTELNVFDALRCTRLSIKTIANGCGFRDEADFSKLFQAATGRSPRQYRAESQAS